MPFGIRWPFSLGGFVQGVRVALRVSRPLFEHLVDVAAEDGCSRATFWQLIILLGWVRRAIDGLYAKISVNHGTNYRLSGPSTPTLRFQFRY
jgi:hypothetical protein